MIETLRRVYRRLRPSRSKCLRKEAPLSLYRTPDGLRLWLDRTKYLDRQIIDYGVFEPHSTRLTRQLVKPGDVAFDVGANIGYYTALLARLTGPSGRVVSFEPTETYCAILRRNIGEIGEGRVEAHQYGLSDRAAAEDILVGESSATLHWTAPQTPRGSERIELRRLDDVIDGLDVRRIDFMKVDVDGHEPQFLDGAWNTIERFGPRILIEVSHDNLVQAGSNAIEFYRTLVDRGMRVYSEKGLREYNGLRDFLMECGNFTVSANVVISRGPLSRP